MITIYDSASGAALGTLSEEQFKELSDELEVEWAGDEDYYINTDTVEMLQDAAVNNAVIEILQRALAGKEDTDIRWSRS